MVFDFYFDGVTVKTGNIRRKPCVMGSKASSGDTRLATSRLIYMRQRATESRGERRSREETTCPACMVSNLICILLAGKYGCNVKDHVA